MMRKNMKSTRKTNTKTTRAWVAWSGKTLVRFHARKQNRYAVAYRKLGANLGHMDFPKPRIYPDHERFAKTYKTLAEL